MSWHAPQVSPTDLDTAVLCQVPRAQFPFAMLSNDGRKCGLPGASFGHLAGPDGVAVALLAAGGGFGTAVASRIFQVLPSRTSTPVQ